jgi:hypothetical protein
MPATSWKMATQKFQILSFRGVRVTIVAAGVLVSAASRVGGGRAREAARARVWVDDQMRGCARGQRGLRVAAARTMCWGLFQRR